MSTTIKQITFTTIMAVAITVMTLSQCKSPTETATTPTVTEPIAQVDTTTKNMTKDTIKAVQVAPPDTTGKRHGRPPLTLIIKNLRSPTATVVVGLYGTKNKFPDPNDQLKEYHFKPNADTLTALIDDQKFGTYALAIYQDTKGNGKIAKNMIGIPTDPYAFSKNYRPRTKAPNFDDCKFNYDADNNCVTMTMIK